MGPWRALICRARGRPRYPATSSPSPSASSSLSTLVEQQKLDPIGRFESRSYDACASLSTEGKWPQLGLGFLSGSSQIYTQRISGQNAGSLLEDAEEFLLDSNLEGFARLDLGFSEGSLQAFEHKKPWLYAGVLPGEFVPGTRVLEKPGLNAGASLGDTKALLLGFWKQSAPKHAEGFSLHFSMCDAAIRAPGFDGSEGLTIQADSVKRKRKKKMNKHKHRKLRRLANKSRK